MHNIRHMASHKSRSGRHTTCHVGSLCALLINKPEQTVRSLGYSKYGFSLQTAACNVREKKKNNKMDLYISSMTGAVECVYVSAIERVPVRR
jgi:hypothetical protein